MKVTRFIEEQVIGILREAQEPTAKPPVPGTTSERRRPTSGCSNLAASTRARSGRTVPSGLRFRCSLRIAELKVHDSGWAPISLHHETSAVRTTTKQPRISTFEASTLCGQVNMTLRATPLSFLCDRRILITPRKMPFSGLQYRK